MKKKMILFSITALFIGIVICYVQPLSAQMPTESDMPALPDMTETVTVERPMSEPMPERPMMEEEIIMMESSALPATEPMTQSPIEDKAAAQEPSFSNEL